MVERRSASGAQVSWTRFEKDEPALADAAVRLYVAGLLDLPEGARVREQHRHPPAAADWVALIGDYTQRCLLTSQDPRDERALGAIRRALPAVGYRLTRQRARRRVPGRPGAGRGGGGCRGRGGGGHAGRGGSAGGRDAGRARLGRADRAPDDRSAGQREPGRPGRGGG